MHLKRLVSQMYQRSLAKAVKGECATVAVNDKEVSLNVTNDIMRNALTLKGV